ncbi:helix-turn-helix transcriptional regulator [Agrobacterium radiobacter]|uniref:DNA-binding CsgD family transcriptional regulator n=2 Tax=Agrobacterium tumefaciens TaxID=358 RepID=A0AAW8LGK7_AGRTU|nr:helix-turn-helix transcriptional regulator [Agrobacterium tumefaciens]AYM05842.1 DNA-binding protein [Agrobacterium tumefaciens]MBP2511648.1 DNA-binding CsgD family transcriptional regulator [Agrobacterium tumefaciens]MBP2520826.1 DNA-binding CsgD family transcriptional regulator [Agrobacterium tumefaciens]MBP2566728.1 DNA-binding CsgD family transcriptional regulator [Agrobacterium tumefaciens]MBP2571545.1 DNA-binding CsgD family transcriptional regulator [Agrobacterium tumefaciens]
MDNISSADIIDDIYEAALFPDRWAEVIETIGNRLDFWGGALTWGKGEEEAWLFTPNLQDVMQAFMEGGWNRRNDRLTRAIREGQFSFVQDFDVFTHDEWAGLPIVRDFLMPRGLGYGAATQIAPPDHPEMTVLFERKLDSGVIGPETMAALGRLRPHIARSLTLATRLQRQKADAMTLGLNAIGAPAAVLQASGRILSANDMFLSLRKCISTRARDRIVVSDERVNRLLYKALAGDNVGSFPLPTGEDRSCILHVIPLRRNALDLSPKGSAIVLISQPMGTITDATSLLKGLYDLTKGEARVALEIMKGLSLPAVAKQLQISHETVRSNAKSIYAKTGSTGQTDLVRRLSVLTRYNIREQS